MPELPEIESINQALNATILGYDVMSAKFYRSTLRKPIPTRKIKTQIVGSTIVEIRRRSKYLLISSKNHTLISHFGMTGNILIKNTSIPEFKHTHYVLELRKNKKIKYLHYVDPRRFGILDIAQISKLKDHPLLAKLGPEPLEAHKLTEHLFKLGFASQKPIKNFLMEAKNVVGVGNIYASESLFLSKISPLRPASSLSLQDWRELTKCIKRVLRKAIKAGGTTLKDFKTTDGSPGYFKIKLNVYDRAKLPCHVCKSSIKVVRQAGRSTFFCNNCQK